MNIWNIDTVTIFNRWYDTINEIEHYEPTVLKSTNLVLQQGANRTRSGLESADSAKLFVNFEKLPKEYKEPKEWLKLAWDEKEKYLTFNPAMDFFVKGNVADEEVIENFFEYMQNKYDHVYKITTVDIYKNVMPHYEIGGR